MDSGSYDSTSSPRRQLFTEHDGDTSQLEDDEDGLNYMGMDNLKDLDTIHSQMDEKMIPKLGLEFNIEEDAYKFYLAYAKHVGFGIRRHSSHSDANGKLMDRTFCCSCQGHRGKDKRRVNVKGNRPQTRFGCLAVMKIHRVENGKLQVYQTVFEHTHYLASPNKTHLIRAHRQISEVQGADIEMCNSVGIAPKNAHELMAKQAGGRADLGFTSLDYRNYLRTKRQKVIEKGDTGGVLEYLQKMQSADPKLLF